MVMQETTGAWHSVTITAQRWPPVCQVTLMGQRVQAQALSTSPPHLHALLLYYCSPGPVTAPLTNLAGRRLPEPQLPELDTWGGGREAQVNPACCSWADV